MTDAGQTLPVNESLNGKGRQVEVTVLSPAGMNIIVKFENATCYQLSSPS